jgi:hypothetical protein
MAFDRASAVPVGASSASATPMPAPADKAKTTTFDRASAQNVSGKPELYDPTSGMTADEKFAAGMGKAFLDIGHGGQQLYAGVADFVSPRQMTMSDLVAGRKKPLSRYEELQQEEASRRTLDAPLMNTGWGTAGNITGNLVAVAPTMALPGANTLAGSTAIGGLYAALSPTTSEESRAQNVLTGSALGFAAPIALRGANRAWQTVKSLRNPEIAVQNALAARAGTDNQVVNALNATRRVPVDPNAPPGPENTPGFNPTLTERLFSQGVQKPGLASLEASLGQASGPLNEQVLAASNVRLTALKDQLARIDQRLASQRQAMTPQAYESLNQTRQGIVSAIEQEQQALTSAAQRAPAGLPPRTTEPGIELKGQRRVLETETRQNVTDPAYAAAFKAGGNTFISIKGIEGEVQRLMGRPLADIPRGVSRTADKLNDLGGRPSTLKQLHDLRIAVNKDLSAANRQGADASLRELGEVMDAIDDAIASSKLSANAKNLYNTANSLYQREIGDRFRTGLAEQLRRPGSVKEGRILSEDVVAKFLSGERGPGTFATLFRNDPTAADAMSRGVQAVFRQELEAAAPENIATVAEAFMRKHGPALAELEQSGVQARSILGQVQQEVSRNVQGARELQSLAKEFGNDNEQAFMRGLMASPSQMNVAMSRASAAGRSTIASNVVTHVTDMMEQNPEKALKFIADNNQSLSRALQGSGTTLRDLETAAQNIIEFKAVQLPKEPIGNTILDLTANYTDDQLHDLALVAEDVKNMKGAMDLTSVGNQAGTGAAGKLGQEEGERTVSPNNVPGWFSAKIAAIKAGWSAAQGKLTDKALVRLFRYMYEDPDAAIAAIEKGQERLARIPMTKRQLNALGGTAAAGTLNSMRGKTRNQLAPQPTGNNAFAEQ